MIRNDRVVAFDYEIIRMVCGHYELKSVIDYEDGLHVQQQMSTMLGSCIVNY